MANTGQRNVRKCLDKLVKLGELDIAYNQGRGGSNRYKLLLAVGGVGDAPLPSDSSGATIQSPRSTGSENPGTPVPKLLSERSAESSGKDDRSRRLTPKQQRHGDGNCIANEKDTERFVDVWNRMAAGSNGTISPIVGMPNPRRQSLLERLTENAAWLDDFDRAIPMVLNSPFLTGKVNGWRITPEFLLRDGTLVRILEGQYGNLQGTGRKLKVYASNFQATSAKGKT